MITQVGEYRVGRRKAHIHYIGDGYAFGFIDLGNDVGIPTIWNCNSGRAIQIDATQHITGAAPEIIESGGKFYREITRVLA